MGFQTEEKLRCPMCKHIAIELVPWDDSDFAKEGKVSCVQCKRRLRKNEN